MSCKVNDVYAELIVLPKVCVEVLVHVLGGWKRCHSCPYYRLPQISVYLPPLRSCPYMAYLTAHMRRGLRTTVGLW
jgi:hypothetical protein